MRGREWVAGLAARGVLLALPLLTGLVAARSLGPGGRGLIALGTGLAIGVGVIGGLGRWHVIRRELQSHGVGEGTASHVRRDARRIVATSVGLAALGTGIAFVTVSAQDLLSRAFLLGTFVACSMSGIHLYLTSALMGCGRRWTALAGDIIPWLVALPLFCLSLVLGSPSAASYMVSIALGYCVAVLMLVWLLARVLTHAGTGMTSATSEQHNRKGGAASGSWGFDVLDFGAARSDRLYAAIIMPASDAGIYAIAVTFTALWRFMPTGIGLFGASREAVNLPRSLGNRFSHPIALGLMLTSVVLLATALFGPTVAVWLLGDEYASVATPMRILCLGEIALAAYILVAYSMLGGSGARLAFLPPLAGAIAIPILMALVYGSGGVTWAAIAVASVYVVMAVGQFILRLSVQRQGLL